MRRAGQHIARAIRQRCGNQIRPSFVVATAGGLLCGGSLLAVQQIQSECAAAERRADYVVLGGGASAMGGVHGLRKVDQNSSVVVVSPNPSPDFGSQERCRSDAGRASDGSCVEFCALEAADLKNVTFDKTSAVELDVDNQIVMLSDGGRVHYTKGCLIASESEVSTAQLTPLKRAIASSALPYVRMMGEPGAIQEVVDTVAKARERGESWHVTVIGSGAEACVLSSALVARGAVVSQICEEKVILGHAIPHYLGNHIMWMMKRMGVEVLPYSNMQYCRVVKEQTSSGQQEFFEVFVRKSYDRLDVRKHTTNMLLVFPSQTGRSSALVSDQNGLERAADGG